MLIYVASFPRSGNSLMQQIVRGYFKWPITGWARNDKLIVPEICNIRREPDPSRFWFRVRDKVRRIMNVDPLLERWLVRFDREEVFGGEARRDQFTLLPGCGYALSTENRKRLAALETPIFVKTHWLPMAFYRVYPDLATIFRPESA